MIGWIGIGTLDLIYSRTHYSHLKFLVFGVGYRGDSSGMLTKSSYAFCCPKGSDGSQYDGRFMLLRDTIAIIAYALSHFALGGP